MNTNLTGGNIIKKLGPIAYKIHSLVKKKNGACFINNALISLESIYFNLNYSDFLQALDELTKQGYTIQNGIIKAPTKDKPKTKIDSLPPNMKVDPQLLKFI